MALFQRLSPQDETSLVSRASDGDITLSGVLPGPLSSSEDGTEHSETLLHSAWATITTGGTNLGHGKVFVTTECVYFVHEKTGTEEGVAMPGFRMEYKMISLHAICRDENISTQPCIYCHLLLEDDMGNTLVHDDAMESTMHIIPDSQEEVDELFQALSKGAELHPDSDVEEDDDEEGNFIFNEDEVNLNSEQAAALQDLDAKLDLNNSNFRGDVDDKVGNDIQDGQFDDPEI